MGHAERIFFLYDPDTEHIIDLQQPYFSSLLTAELFREADYDNPRHKHPFILDFARLLLEIELDEVIS
jgi:hypothetical protein